MIKNKFNNKKNDEDDIFEKPTRKNSISTDKNKRKLDDKKMNKKNDNDEDDIFNNPTGSTVKNEDDDIFSTDAPSSGKLIKPINTPKESFDDKKITKQIETHKKNIDITSNLYDEDIFNNPEKNKELKVQQKKSHIEKSINNISDGDIKEITLSLKSQLMEQKMIREEIQNEYIQN